jgi:hypothetical protein
MARREFEPWVGHVPRDRASIWYIVPALANVIGIALLVAAVVVIAMVVFT